MGDELKRIITSTVIRVLRPLVRILLRNGISYGMFCELARWVYVDVAFHEFTIPGRKQSTSRVAVLTGLTRKEVKRLREIPEADDLGASERYNRIVRVISAWTKDSRFVNKNNNPKPLPIEGEISFTTLVKHYSGDMTPRAVLDEMLRTGVVEVKEGYVRLLEKGYIVRKDEGEKLHILGTDVGELIETIDHNITHPPEAAFLQRKVAYDNIPETAIPEIRRLLHEKGREFLLEIDQIISKYDRDVNPSVQGEGRKRAGLGIYYFEGDIKGVKDDKGIS